MWVLNKSDSLKPKRKIQEHIPPIQKNLNSYPDIHKAVTIQLLCSLYKHQKLEFKSIHYFLYWRNQWILLHKTPWKHWR
jgi:hypothetical protein